MAGPFRQRADRDANDSGNGQTATRTTDKPTLGENEQGGKYMNPNAVNGTFSGYSFTAAQATLDAVNAMPAHVTKEICAKAVTYATDMSFFGFRGAGGTFGSRGDGSCNVYFNYRGCGGGGCIAIRTSSTNGFTGTVTAYGGDNGYAYPNAATEGSVYWKIVGGLNIILR